MTKYEETNLDNLYRDILYLIHDRRCFVCGVQGDHDPHHIVHRANLSTRWYIPNGILLCRKHHIIEHASGGCVDELSTLYGDEYLFHLARVSHETSRYIEIDLIYLQLLHLKMKLKKQYENDCNF